jgi:hypothetical protein
MSQPWGQNKELYIRLSYGLLQETSSLRAASVFGIGRLITPQAAMRNAIIQLSFTNRCGPLSLTCAGRGFVENRAIPSKTLCKHMFDAVR